MAAVSNSNVTFDIEVLASCKDSKNPQYVGLHHYKDITFIS